MKYPVQQFTFKKPNPLLKLNPFSFKRLAYFYFIVVMPELSKKLLNVIACPKCKGNLAYKKQEQKLLCKKCRLAYRIENNIPIMLLEEAEKI